jgi:acyl-coenzyme A synthetase/AMP-(fatty) acid ligase
MNAAEFLLAAGDGGRLAIECGTRKITYGELRRAVAAATGAWRELGLAGGERVLIFAPDSIDWVIAYLAAIRAGGVAVGLNNRLFETELSVILAESKARFVWCDDESAALLSRLCSALPQPPRVVARVDWLTRLAAASPLPAAVLGNDDPALWIYTSGTTGVPKAVIHAQRTVLAADAFARGVLGLQASDRLYATSKLFFAYALGNALFAGLRLGATVILDGEWPNAERAAEVVAAHRPTVVFSVPTLYRKMLSSGAIAGFPAQGVRHLVSAGEAMPDTLAAGLHAAAGVAPVGGYGTSETLFLMFTRREDAGAVSLQPTPGTAVRATSADAAPQRIWIAHGSVALGYWQRPEQERDSFRDGEFSPGDLFRAGRDGWEFCGRTDDMLKISGQWVSTLAVETALGAACGDTVQELAAAGYTNADGLTSIALFGVAAENRADEARRRLGAAIAALPGFQRPRLVRWVDELPHTATGKLQRNRLAAIYLKEANAS